jgi:PAS domain S-box-containing protein
MIYSTVPDAITPREISLMEELAGDLAFGINVLRTRAERRRAEQEIALLSFALNNVHDAAFLIEENSRFHFVNRASCSILGYTREELLGLCVTDIDPDFAAERWVSHWNDLRAKGVLRFEGRHRTKDGRILPVEINANYFEYGGRAYNLALVRDITERKRAEEVLRLAGIYNRSLIEASLDPLVTIDPEGRISDVNTATEQATGYTRGELVGTDFSDYFTEPERARAGYQQVFDQGFVRDYELEIRNRNGKITPVLYNASVYRDDTGNVIGVFAAARDITEQKHAEEARSRLAAIVESTDDAIISKDLGGMITSWNAGAERLYGYPASEALGRPVTILIPQGQQNQFAVFMSQIREGIRIEHYETERVRKDGKIIDVSLTLSPIRDHQDRIVGASAIARDITERKRAEEALRQTATSLEEAQRLAHIGNWELDLTNDVLTWSDEIYRIFEIDPGKFGASYKAFLEAIHPDDREAVNAAYNNSLKTRAPYSITHRLCFPDGRMKYVHEQCETFYVDDKPVRSLGTVQDITERKLAEEALRLAGAYNRSLIEASLDPLVTIDPEGRISDVNAATEQVTGYSRSELIGTDFSDYFTESEKARSGYRQVFNEGLVRDYELTIRHRDGKTTPVIYNASVYRDEAGKVIGVFAAARDITERKETLRFFQNMDRINRAMQGTNDLEQMMRDVLDTTLSIFECDRAFLIYPCDPDAPSFEAAMERTRPGYPVRRGAIPAAPDTAKHFQLYLASSGAVTLGPGGDYPLETARFGEKSKIMIALYPKTGKPWVLGMHQCSYPRVWSEDDRKLLGELARRVGDALTSLLAHRDLHESEERNRVTLQTAMDGFFRTDVQGRFLEVNETYCRMSGYSEQELLTMNMGDISAQRTAEMVAAEIRRAAEEGSQRFESVHRRKDGSLFDVEISAQYQPVAGGQAVVFVRDITERKRAEEALQNLMADLESRVKERTKELSEANESLESANKELESFSYSVSHDLRAPLRAIDGFSMMVLQGYADKLDDEGRRKLNVIRANTQQMGRLIDDLLAFSRLGRKELVTARLDMEALVRSVWRELTLANPERRIQFSVQRLPPAAGDQALIKEVVANLLSNAIKFSKYRDTATIEVGAYPEEKGNVYFVKDNGVGFDMRYHDKLFGVFQRLHSADEFEGTGVGLAIVERIVHRHGGRVWAEGKEGEGATFYFTLTRKE